MPSETTPDPINRLADVIMGRNYKSSVQTLMVRLVSTTTLTFDGRYEKFEVFEDLFHTMMRIQPDMTETMKITHFHSLLRKNRLRIFRKISSANRQALEDILAVFCRKFVKFESQANTNGINWCLTRIPWNCLIFSKNLIRALETFFVNTHKR